MADDHAMIAVVERIGVEAFPHANTIVGQNRVKRVLAALKPGDRLPGGLVVVPEEATLAMQNAAWRWFDENDYPTDDIEVAPPYHAMIAASGD